MDTEFNVDGRRIIATGDIDMDCVDQFQAALEKAAAADDRSIVIEMSGVTFLDSTGLRHLLAARSDGRSVAIESPSSAVVRLLELTSTREFFGLG